MTLSSKGSSGTCIPEGVATFFHAAFTAHSGSEARADAFGSQVQGIVRLGDVDGNGLASWRCP
jgi:hypothetical protein